MKTANTPEIEGSALSALAALTEEEFGALRTSISEASPSVKRSLMYSKAVSSLPEVPKGNIDGILSAVAYFASLLGPTDTPGALIEDVLSQWSQHEGSSSDPAKTEILRTRLNILLRIESLHLSAKAADLAVETTQFLENIRIVTDIRPVFGGDKDLDVRGALVMHTLKLEYFTSEGSKELYIAIDDDDIGAILRAIERAQSKALVLRSILQRSKITDLNPAEPNVNV